jgi:hypothetical protein
MKSRTSLRRAACLAAVVCLVGIAPACEQSEGPRTGSNSNWLSPCLTDADCGGRDCHCGVCTPTCTANEDCANYDSSVCAQPDRPAVWTQCETMDFAEGLCLASCQPGECPPESMCVAASCVYVPLPEADLCTSLAETDAELRQREEEVLDLLQRTRREGATACGADVPQALPELRLDARLMCAARALAQNFDPTSSTPLVDTAGRDTLERVELAGYTPYVWADALATGQDAATVFDLMVTGPQSCPVVLDASVADIGVGCTSDLCVLTFALEM